MKYRELPNIAARGVPIEPANPYPEIRKHAEKNREWVYSGEVGYLNRKFNNKPSRRISGAETGFEFARPAFISDYWDERISSTLIHNRSNFVLFNRRSIGCEK
jgi:hypothetical protein